MSCEVADLGHIIGKKWSIAIIEEIALERFDGFNNFLRKSKKITPRTLSLQLKELEKAGLIKSTSGKRKTVTKYILTKKGADLQEIIQQMKEWHMKWDRSSKICRSVPCTECPEFYKD